MSWVRFRSFWIFPGLGIAGVIVARRIEPGRSFSEWLYWVPAGLLLWTILEYVFHRFVFHRFTTGLHIEHHHHPRDLRFALVQPELAVAISAALAFVLWAVTGSLWRTTGILSGVWAGFLYYEIVHLCVHLSNAGKFRLSLQRRRHFHHHFQNNQANFGLTSPLWDIVFRTRS